LHRGTFRVLGYSKKYSGDQIKKSEIGRACGTYGERERCIKVLLGKHEVMS
jgi:hypothetical protein